MVVNCLEGWSCRSLCCIWSRPSLHHTTGVRHENRHVGAVLEIEALNAERKPYLRPCLQGYLKLAHISITSHPGALHLSHALPWLPSSRGRFQQPPVSLLETRSLVARYWQSSWSVVGPNRHQTVDTNSAFFAKYCFSLGIALKRVEVIADDEAEIIEAVRRMSSSYDFVVTSGGIGPT
jgi:Probable molybdopterin binding domain